VLRLPHHHKAPKRYKQAHDTMFKSKFTALFLATILASCISNELSNGTNTIIKELANPNKTKKAILFSREAGATVDNSYQLSITEFNSKFDTTSVGNTFTVDADHNEKLSLRPDLVNLKWVSNDTLKIEYSSGLRTFIKNEKVNNVKVTYELQ